MNIYPYAYILNENSAPKNYCPIRREEMWEVMRDFIK